jgi:hypothetical protein
MVELDKDDVPVIRTRPTMDAVWSMPRKMWRQAFLPKAGDKFQMPYDVTKIEASITKHLSESEVEEVRDHVSSCYHRLTAEQACALEVDVKKLEDHTDHDFHWARKGLFVIEMVDDVDAKVRSCYICNLFVGRAHDELPVCCAQDEIAACINEAKEQASLRLDWSRAPASVHATSTSLGRSRNGGSDHGQVQVGDILAVKVGEGKDDFKVAVVLALLPDAKDRGACWDRLQVRDYQRVIPAGGEDDKSKWTYRPGGVRGTSKVYTSAVLTKVRLNNKNAIYKRAPGNDGGNYLEMVEAELAQFALDGDEYADG